MQGLFRLSILLLCILVSACGGDYASNSSATATEPVTGSKNTSDPSFTSPRRLFVDVTQATPTAASLQWTGVPSPDVTDFRILRDGQQIMLAEDIQRRFRDVDLAPNTSYAYEVQALDAKGRKLAVGTVKASTVSGAASLTAADVPPADVMRGRSLTTFGWTPNPLYDTCSKALHDSFWTFGPDNKAYPTWHPPVYEFADGSTCRFGHEHGQDQRQSNLYRTVGPISFGYVNEQLSPSDPSFQRNEDHVGHKVALFNGILDIVSGPNGDATGTMPCDILFKLHQGTHSPDALRNNSHERFLNYSCPNGLEIRYKSLQPFGMANTFLENIPNRTSTLISTLGATPAPCAGSRDPNCQPSGADRRSIPTMNYFQGIISNFGGQTDGTGSNPFCDNCRGTAQFAAELAAIGVPAPGYYVSNWNGESWQGGPVMLFFNSSGQRIFQLGGGPYWNLASSSRYYDSNGDANPANTSTYKIARQIDLCYRTGSLVFNSFDCRLARSRNGGQPIAFDSPMSPFKGTVRFNETNFIQLFNPDPRRERIFFDPYGRTSMDGDDGVNPRDELPLKRSTKYSVRGYFKATGTSDFNIKLANWAGTNQCGGGSCWTDFNFYRLRNGQTVDADIHIPN